MKLQLGIVLERVLEQKGLTLKDLARETQIKASTLSGWKNGVSPRDLVEVRKCAQFLGVSLEKLLFDEEPDQFILDDLKTERLFDGYLKVNIERVIPKKR